MPNWCYTSLTISGDNKELDRFLSGLKKDDNGKISIVDSYLPCPEELKETVDGWSSDEEEQNKREELYARNIEKYGYKSWYDWQYTEWGTKWGDCDTDVQGDFITYNTAWGTMTRAWVRISEMFPNLLFEFEHEEEAGFFCGYEFVKNGAAKESFFAPCEYDKGVEWDNDESVEEYREWCDKMKSQCYEKYRLLMMEFAS